MIEYSFWVDDKVDGVEALVFKSSFDQNKFSKVTKLDSIVGLHPENAKGTNKAIVLPDPVVDNSLVYNGTRKGRKYKTVVEYEDGFSSVEIHDVVGVRSISYPVDREIVSIKSYTLNKLGSEKQVFEVVK